MLSDCLCGTGWQSLWALLLLLRLWQYITAHTEASNNYFSMINVYKCCTNTQLLIRMPRILWYLPKGTLWCFLVHDYSLQKKFDTWPPFDPLLTCLYNDCGILLINQLPPAARWSIRRVPSPHFVNFTCTSKMSGDDMFIATGINKCRRLNVNSQFINSSAGMHLL